VTATPDLIDGFTSLQEAVPAYKRAELMYDGDVGEIFTSPFIRHLLARAGVDSVDEVNFAHIPVDTVANRLLITAVTASEAEDEAQVGQRHTVAPTANGAKPPKGRKSTVDAAQDVINHLIERNQLDAESKSLHLDTCKTGDGYLFVWPVLDDSGNVVDVDMLVNSSSTVRVIYDEQQPLVKAYAVKSWSEKLPGDDDKTVIRANLYYPDRVQRWVTEPDMDGSKPEHWVEFVDPGDAEEGRDPVEFETPNPPGVDQVPFFHFRTGRPYGKPEHRHAYGPQQLINKLVQAQAATIDFQTFPQRYVLMDPKADDILQNFTDPFNTEDDAEDPEDPGNVSQLRGDPASVWKLFGASNAGEFSTANPDNFMRPLDRYILAMAQTTETPLFHFQPGGDAPSGESLRVQEAPTTAKVKDRQDRFGPEWQDGFEFAVRLMGIDGIRVKIQWQPAQTINDQAGWATVQSKIGSGVPVEQALVETGYPQEQVDEWFSAEHTLVLDMQRRVEILTQFATAAQALGAAIGLGAVDASEVKAFISSILGDLAPPGLNLEAAAKADPNEGPPEWAKPPAPPPPGQQGDNGGGGQPGGKQPAAAGTRGAAPR
jgi:hypothetical protein